VTWTCAACHRAIVAEATTHGRSTHAVGTTTNPARRTPRVACPSPACNHEEEDSMSSNRPPSPTPDDAASRAVVAQIETILNRLMSPGRLGTTAAEARRKLQAGMDEIERWPSPEGAQRALEILRDLDDDLAVQDPEETLGRVRSNMQRGPFRVLGPVTWNDWTGRAHTVEIDETNALPFAIDALEQIQREPNLLQQQILKQAILDTLDLLVPPRRGKRPGSATGTESPRCPFDRKHLREEIYRPLLQWLETHRLAGGRLPDAWALCGEDDAPEETLRRMPPSEMALRLIAKRVGLADETGWQTVQDWIATRP
jgi:hypothetical protein